MELEEFINYYILHAAQIMWFLGAGASRSAGMPSATDIIWDLKRKYYCLKENREITDNELSNEAVRNKIQSYLEIQDCPPMWSEGEYAYYFKLVFGNNPQLHQKYLEEKLNPSLISINSGHRVLAALLGMSKARLVFTTNFDSVVETAYASVTGKDLHAFGLNGSYAALNALNNEAFPIYAKMHGDFRYFEMKNLPAQLVENDTEIEKCFVNACSRYGLIVNGYSGRDTNVMSAFDKAIDNPNSFPKGLFWFTSVEGNIFKDVEELISKAKAKGINAHIIKGDTFDALLTGIWKQTTDKVSEFDKKIRRAIFEIPKVNKYPTTANYPLIRTNAFPIISMPKSCLSIETKVPINMAEFKEKIINAKSGAIIIKEKTVLAWGTNKEIFKVIPETDISNSSVQNIESSLENFRQNTLINSFYSRALAISLVRNKALKLKRRKDHFYAVISSKNDDFSIIEPVLKKGLATYNFTTRQKIEPEKLAGFVPGIKDTYWMECVQISIEYFDGRFYMILVPDIWIEPNGNRKLAKDFLIEKKKTRFNQVQNELLNAWKEILLGSHKQVILKAFDEEEPYNAIFTLNTTTAFSFRQNNE